MIQADFHEMSFDGRPDRNFEDLRLAKAYPDGQTSLRSCLESTNTTPGFWPFQASLPVMWELPRSVAVIGQLM